ncbi:DUF2802 domain-containing protein [Zooshikella ganghwensis]|uniref:DUF2802 domain-containing protein n=1 Tax=Zooshikella ganghwensis TaxID=202772 RepID=A0A4P9VML1_9GAMM|nr:DUF2802 domain-containing protein [Zooshikella ganghwensis]RDH43624.1 DUF2802 domain-containing protein [Zooshikella ganghwensis]
MDWLWPLIGIAFVIFVLQLSMMFAVYRWRLQQQQSEQQLQRLQEDLKAVAAGAIGVGKHLQDVEAKLYLLVDKQEILEQRDLGSLPYNQASKLLEMGASTQEVASSCGLTQAEVELLARFHPVN